MTRIDSYIPELSQQLDDALTTLKFRLDMLDGLDENVLVYKLKQLSEGWATPLLELQLIKDNLKAFKTYSSGVKTLVFEKVSFKDLISEIKPIIQVLADHKGVSIVWDINAVENKRFKVVKKDLVLAFINIFRIGIRLSDAYDTLTFSAKKNFAYDFTWSLDKTIELHDPMELHLAREIILAHNGKTETEFVNDKTLAIVSLST